MPSPFLTVCHPQIKPMKWDKQLSANYGTKLFEHINILPQHKCLCLKREQTSRVILILFLTKTHRSSIPPQCRQEHRAPHAAPPRQRLRAQHRSWAPALLPALGKHTHIARAELHFGLPSDFTKHEMCFTCWVQPQEHSHVSFIQPFCCSLCPHCFLIALHVGSSSVCFHPPFIDLSLANVWHHMYMTPPLPAKQTPPGSKDRLVSKSAFC